MKQTTRVIVAAMALSAGLGTGWGARGQQRGIPIEGYAAKVNDRVIMVSEVMALVRSSESRLRDTVQGDALRQALEKAYKEALDTLIERELILEEYERKEGEIPPEAIDDQVRQVLSERFDNDRNKLLQALQQEHMSYEDWRKQIREQLIISVMRREAVLEKLSISPNAAREIYETNFEKDYYTPPEVKLRMFTVQRGSTENETLEQAARIKGARERIAAGESFGDVARELSEGSKASTGGDWGWIPVRDLRAELGKIVNQLEPGQLSRIVAAGENLYLMQVEDRHAEVVVPLEDVRDTLEQELRRAELTRIQDEWTARLRKKNFIKIY